MRKGEQRAERRSGTGRTARPGYVTALTAVTGVVAALALAGCGSSSSGSSDSDGGQNSGGQNGGGQPTTSVAEAHDKGPACVGSVPADGGVHVLRGGGFQLPGGGGVQYAAATADGTTRTATLRDGARYQDGQTSQKVVAGGQLTVSGHSYTVSQICSYRVVLEPKDAKARTALAAAPAKMKAVGGAADSGLCFTTNAAVRTAAANGFPAKGATWSLANNSGRQMLPTGLSVALYSVDSGSGTAVIGANCAAIPVASYKDAAVGDTLEFGGVTFKVASLSHSAVVLNRTS